MATKLSTLHQRWRTALRSNDLNQATALLAAHGNRLDLESRRGLDGEIEFSSLDLAVRHGSPALIQLVLNANVNVNATSWTQDTALHQAAGRARAEAIDLLIAAGALLNPPNHMGFTPLMDAARTGVAAPVRALLNAGADPRAVDHDGQTALHHAMTKGSADIAAALIEAGADLWAVAENGQTALHVMCEHVLLPHVLDEWVKRAERDGVAWDVPDQDGDHPLHLAIRSGRGRAVNALLDLGVPPDQPTAQGTSALDLAREQQVPAVYDRLQAACVAREQAALRQAMPVPDTAASPATPAVPERALRRL